MSTAIPEITPNTTPDTSVVSFRLTADGVTRSETNVPLSAVRERLGDELADLLAAKQAQEQANAAALAYLAATDWYLVRNAETGAGVPDDILTQRAAQRAVVAEVSWDITL
jgi:hypothetical protein